MRKLPFPPLPVNGAIHGAICATFLLVPGSPLPAADWPNFRGPALDGIAEGPDLRGSGELPLAWSAAVGLGYSAATVARGRVLISGHDGEGSDALFCLDESTGAELWVHRYSQPLGDLYFQGGTTGTATVAAGRVYHLAREGELFCLDLEDGRVLWQRHMQEDFSYSKPTWGFTGAPLVQDGMVFVTAGDAGLALRAGDGEVIWRSADEEAGYSAPFPLEHGGRDLLIFSNKRDYVCVQAGDGAEVWRQRWMTRYGVNAADPVATGAGLLISSGYGKGAVMLRWEEGASRPQPVWQNRELRTQMNAALYIDGYLYAIDGNERQDGTGLKCLDPATGAALWSDPSIGHGAVAAVRGGGGTVLVVLTEEGELQLAEASPGGYDPFLRQEVVEPHVWTVPVIANGRIYCRNAAGTLAVLRAAGDS